jgi:hypothetical protein
MATEASRRILAVVVMGIFALSILAGFVTIWLFGESDSGSMAERADVALRIGAPVVAIVGTVLGFYFGREEA